MKPPVRALNYNTELNKGVNDLFGRGIEDLIGSKQACNISSKACPSGLLWNQLYHLNQLKTLCTFHKLTIAQ